MIINFEKNSILKAEKQSIMDILSMHFENGTNSTKIFLRVNISDDIDNILLSQ